MNKDLRPKHKAVIPACIAFFLLATLFQQSLNLVQSAGQVKYVSKSATGNNSGDSWGNAYTDLQTALSSVTAGDEIWVASGVYTPGVTITDTFLLVDDVSVYGGFNGTENVRSARDFSSNLTILSGDIGGDDWANSDGIIQSTNYITGQNSLHVVTALDMETTSAVLDGFVITGGYAQGEYPATTGGGMYVFLSRLTISNVSFIGNYASQWGGGIYNNKESHTTLINLTFYGNESGSAGGGMFNLFSNPKLANNLFVGNSSRNGGALYNYSSQSTISNITMSGNVATSEAGGFYNDANSSATVSNAIFWDNKDQSGIGSLAANFVNKANSAPVIRYSLLQGSGGSGSWNSSAGQDGGQNIDTDPLFITDVNVNSTPIGRGNLQLQSTSLAIDVGDTSAYSGITGTAIDVGGENRIENVVIDMGAYEVPFDPAAAKIISVTIAGGSGSVGSSPVGISCPADCDHTFRIDRTIVLTANPINGSEFVGWDGDCSGSTLTCTLVTNSNKVVTATFNLLPTPTQTATSTETATPTVTSTPTETPTPSQTATSTLTATATQTETPTQTPTATGTPTLIATATATSMADATMTAEPSLTPTTLPTSTPTGSPTATPLPTATMTPTIAATSVPTLTPTEVSNPVGNGDRVEIFLPYIRR